MRGMSPSQKYYNRRFKTQTSMDSKQQADKPSPNPKPSFQQTKLKHPSSPILVLKIDMEDGRIEDLRIHSSMELPADCENFCAKYSLAADFHENLVLFCKKELESISVTLQAQRVMTEPDNPTANQRKALKKTKVVRKPKPAAPLKSTTQRNLKSIATPAHKLRTESAARDMACLGSSRRVTSKVP